VSVISFGRMGNCQCPQFLTISLALLSGDRVGWGGVGDELDVILSLRGAMRPRHKVLTIKFDEKRTWGDLT